MALSTRFAAVLGRSRAGLLHTSALSRSQKPQTMKQVEVDEPTVQNELGKLQMDLVKKAEKMNLDHAKRHRKFRKKDWAIAMASGGLAIAIYAYSIYAIKQEKFLDDFDMPDPLDEKDRSHKR
jgi:hypothetical protein